MTPIATRRLRLAGLAFLAVYGVVSLRTPGAGRLLDGIDLAIHETGHLVFAPFGEFVAVLGGTLFQLAVPGAFVAYFLMRRERYAAGVCLWWVGQSCWNVSVYVADARAQELPLVGGGMHDWTYLLGETALLPHDLAIARAIHTAGVVLAAAALWLGLAGALAPTPEPPADQLTARLPGAASRARRAPMP